MFEVRGLLEGPTREVRLVPIQLPVPPVQVRILVPYHLQISLEQRKVPHIETRDGRIQPDVSLRDMLPKQERSLAALDILFEQSFEPIERREQWIEMSLVRLLRRRKAGFVHAVIDGIVHPFVQLVDLLVQWTFRVIPSKAMRRLPSLGWEQSVECSEEHPDYLARLVVDDSFPLFVPEDGDGVAAYVGWFGFEVELFVLGESVEWVVRVGAVYACVHPGMMEDAHE